MKLIYQICDDIWIHLSSYFDNIKYLLRLRIALNKRSSQFDMERLTFWLKIVEQFYKGQREDYYNFLQNLSHTNIFQANNASAILRELFSNKKCSRTGCFKIFTEISNKNGTCKFHPGRKNSSGFLSCCRERTFQSEGCKKGYHDGFFHNVVFCQRTVETDNVSYNTEHLASPNTISTTSKNSLPKIIDNVLLQTPKTLLSQSNQIKLPKI